MSANLLLHPNLDITKASAGAAYPKIIHPATQNWIDQIYNPIHRLRSVTTKNLLEFAKQGRPGFHLRGDPYSPFPAASLRPHEVKPKKAKGLTLGEIDCPGLFWVHLHIKLSQFFQEPSICRLDKPIPSLKAIYEDNQVVGIPGIVKVLIFASASDFLGTLQHFIHLVEIDITEQGRNHPSLRNPSFATSFQNKVQQRHHPSIVDSFGYLLEEQVMPNMIKVGLEVHINDLGFVSYHCLGYQVYGRLGSPLGSISIRPCLEVRFKDRL
jgi:hypothetical protein